MFKKGLMSLVVLAVAGAAQAATEYYIATDGSDSNAGTTASPFATLEKARDTIRSLKSGSGLPAGGVSVYLRGGVYSRTSTFNLTSLDSGEPGKPVFYRSYPGEEVSIVGGRELDPGWFSLVTSSSPVWARLDDLAKGNLMQVDLGAHGITDYGQLNPGSGMGGGNPPLELNFNGDMMQLARWPNDSFQRTVSAPNGMFGKEFECSGTRPERWTAAPDPWVFGYWHWNFMDDYVGVASINTTTKVLTLTTNPPAGYGIIAGQRWYAFNLLEEIDIPGEWYLDRSSGILYFWPPEDLRTGTTLVSILKDRMVYMNGVSYVTLRELTFEVSREGGIMMSGGSNNLISKCTMRSFATYGAYITGGARNCGVEGCKIYDLDYGVALFGGNRSALTPGNNFATNNHIHDWGRWSRTYAPAVSINGCGNKISHNLMHDAPHSAITHSGNNHMMEYNIIHHVVQETSDSSAVYSGRSWAYQGNVIRYNFFHHIVNTVSSDINAIYLDDMLSGYTVFGNVFYIVAKAGIFNNGGRDNISENNVFVRCKYGNLGTARGIRWIDCDHGSPWNMLASLQAYDYQNPPWSTAYPKAAAILNDCTSPGFERYKSPGGSQVVRNIGWLNTEFMYDVDNAFRYYAAVEDNIEDQDPLFVDEKNLNLALRDDSPAYDIPGFQRIPFEKIGLIRDGDGSTMIFGAIANDGSGPPGASDGSITPTASQTVGGVRTPDRAINGTGILHTGGSPADRNNYAHTFGTNAFGDANNFLADINSTKGNWFKVDLGQTYTLKDAFFFNFNPDASEGGLNNEDRGVATVNIWYLDAAADPNANNDGNDSAFISTGWTQLGSTFNFTMAPTGDVNQAVPDVIDFGDVPARFVALDILTNHGDPGFVGFGEIQFFAVPIPEPSVDLAVIEDTLGACPSERLLVCGL